jgi:hypothetical protein
MMKNREVVKGQIYKHFKGTIHKIVCLAYDSETKEKLVVYTHEEDGTIWVRPLEMFLSEVDHKKYPDIKATYRFELIEDETK